MPVQGEIRWPRLRRVTASKIGTPACPVSICKRKEGGTPACWRREASLAASGGGTPAWCIIGRSASKTRERFRDTFVPDVTASQTGATFRDPTLRGWPLL